MVALVPMLLYYILGQYTNTQQSDSSHLISVMFVLQSPNICYQSIVSFTAFPDLSIQIIYRVLGILK